MVDVFDAIVIGAGHNGLVCATYLAKSGLGVSAVEASHRIGGVCVADSGSASRGHTPAVL